MMPRGKRKVLSVEEELQLIEKSLKKAEDTVKELKSKKKELLQKKKEQEMDAIMALLQEKGMSIEQLGQLLSEQA